MNEWMRNLEIAIRTTKFHRDEFPIDCGLPTEVADQIMALIAAHAPSDAERIEELAALLEKIRRAVNRQKSVNHDEITTNLDDLPFAIMNLQDCYADAARARNGMYTKMQARAEKAEAENQALRAAPQGTPSAVKHSLEKYGPCLKRLAEEDSGTPEEK